jgi:uncharacterized protein
VNTGRRDGHQPTPSPADPGAVPTRDRALAPDLARGGMLLLIALANVHVYVYARSIGVRGYPQDLSPVERVVAVVQLTLVDGRAYPLFALLFGYGIWQLTARRVAVGPGTEAGGACGAGGAGKTLPADAVIRIVRRRGWWMVAIGFGHALLLWSGDIVGIYGVVGVVFAGMFVYGTDRALLRSTAVSVVLGTLLGAANGLVRPGARAMLPSVALADPLDAALARVVEWLLVGVGFGMGVFGAVAYGVWAARRGYLDEPERFRPLLRRAAVLGIAAAALGGLPLALVAVGVLPPTPGLAVPAAALHALSGYAGGVGYAALFGLFAIRVRRRGQGPLSGALLACGQRSLSCYLAQSVAFAALLPAWTLGLGAGLSLELAALVGVGTWAVILVVAVVTARAGYRGPAEVLLRRLTYGPR